MKRAIATDYIPLNLWVADERYAYGTSATPAQTLERLVHGERTTTAVHDFGSGTQVIRIFVTDLDGEIFVCLKDTGTSVHTLWRSTNYGDTFALVLTHPAANIYLLYKGLCVGYPGGVRTYALVEYLSGSGPQAVRVMTSLDGITWESQASVTAGSSENIRHWHNIAWNPYNEQWYLCSGDTNAQSMVITTTDLTLITDTTAAAIVATAGITGRSGAQKCRTVDFLFTEKHVFTAADTLAGGIADRGVFRWSHDLLFVQQVDVGDGRYTDGSDSRSTMWTGVKAEGHLLFGSYEQTDVAGEKHLGIFAAKIGEDGPGQWREIARVYTRNGTTSDMRGLWYGAGHFGYCFARGAGKQTQNETAVFELQGEFTDDILKHSAITGKPIYIPDTIHPVYWVSESGSNANSGYNPDEPWGDITFALRGTTGAGNKTITGITESSGLATVTTSAAHGYVAGSRVTLAGNDPAAYNDTWVVLDAPTTTTFRIRAPSGTGATSVNGTCNDIGSSVTYGGKIVVSGELPVPTSFNINVAQFPTNSLVSGIFGYEGEAGHPIMIAGAEIASATIYGLSTTTGVAPFTLNGAADFLIFERLKIYNERVAASSRALYPLAAGAKCWARDAQVGDILFNAQAIRAGNTSDQAHYLWRCDTKGDTAGGGVNQPAIESDGTAVIYVLGCDVNSTYRGVRCRTAGSGLVVKGSYIHGHSQAGIDTVASNNTGVFIALGNIIVSANGTASSINSSAGTFSGGFSVGGNLTDVTPSQTRDRGGIDMQALTTTLEDYFVDGDPSLGLKAGSAAIEAAGAYLGRADYAGSRRKNPSSIGHLEYRSGIRPAALTRPAASR